jgi:hypothetical protein
MLKKGFQITLIITALVLMLAGGNYILQKQSNDLVFENFISESNYTTVFIPNANRYIKVSNKVNLNDTLSFPTEINKANINISELQDFDFNSSVSNSIQLAFNEDEFILGFKNYSLSINHLVDLLFSEFEITAIADKKTINFNDNSYNYKKIGQFLIISNVEIKINNQKLEKNGVSGNYDYSIKNGVTKYFKSNKDVLMSFKISDLDTVKGRPINPKKYYNIIPSDFNSLYYYGSSRFDIDKRQLLSTSDNSNFYTWIENDFVYIKKDSFELIIGKQNEFQSLSDIFEESTLLLSKDSLLPTPIYKNNFKINFFKSNFDWQSILPISSNSFNVFTENNDFNIIANNLNALNWYISEIQLGNTFKPDQNNLYIPSKTHILEINNSDLFTAVKTKNWINKNTCVIAESRKSSQSIKQSSIRIVSQFTPTFTPTKVKSFVYNDTIFTLIFNKNRIALYNFDGKITYSNNIDLIQSPTIVEIKNTPHLLFCTSNSINILNLKTSENINGFPLESKESIKSVTPILYNNSEYRLLIELPNTLKNYNITGQITEGWNIVNLRTSVKSEIRHQLINSIDYIYFIDLTDSLHVLDRKGNYKFDKKIHIPNKSHSVLMSGNEAANNLKLLTVKNGIINNHYVNQQTIDSTNIENSVSSNNAYWVIEQNKNMFIIEEFNRVLIFNEYGLLEKEITKPSNNLSYFSKKSDNNKRYLFGNLSNNELYLLNKFGAKINNVPIYGTEIFDQTEGFLTTLYNGQVLIYQY